MSNMLATTHILANEQAITQDSSYTGPWITVRTGEAFNFWYFMESTAATIDIDLHIALFPPGYGGAAGDTTFDNFAPDSAARTNYRVFSLVDDSTTEDAWTVVDHDESDDELLYPFVAIRCKVTEKNTGAVDNVSVLMCCNGAR